MEKQSDLAGAVPRQWYWVIKQSCSYHCSLIQWPWSQEQGSGPGPYKLNKVCSMALISSDPLEELVMKSCCCCFQNNSSLTISSIISVWGCSANCDRHQTEECSLDFVVQREGGKNSFTAVGWAWKIWQVTERGSPHCGSVSVWQCMGLVFCYIVWI